MKTDKNEKSSQPDRTTGAEKTKRPKRKDKGEKDKAEKIKSRKAKGQSPLNLQASSELESSFEGGSGRGRASEQDAQERQKSKGDGESVSGNQLVSVHQDKSERTEIKTENSELPEKSRLKKHLKSETVNDGKDSSVESDRLAARKRRFADSSGKPIRQKRHRHEEDEVSQPPDYGSSTSYLKESDVDKHKDSQRRESRIRSDKSSTQKDVQDDVKGQREKPEGSLEQMESKRHQGPSSSRRFSLEGTTDQSSVGENDNHPPLKVLPQTADPDKTAKVKEEPVDIDLSQSYRKQMEQNRRLNQQKQQRESDKLEKPGSPHGNEAEDLEHKSLVHEVGKPPEDVTDNFPSHKLKKIDHFDTEQNSKRERVYRSFRQKSEDPEWNSTNSPGRHHSVQQSEEDLIDVSHKDLIRNEDKSHPDLELLVKRTHNTQVGKPITQSLNVEEEQQKRWESRKQELLPDLNFSRSLGKNLQNRKRLEYGIWHDLEPGEVRSDNEEERENKPYSPMPSTSMPFSERPRVDRFSDPKLAHLERNKFYSFALDQTITPDTKALLERAKSLSSSREDNWSFLDYDSHFASFRTRKDTEKVESTPRPTPSWYMKKKKIRSGSEDKLDDRKEEPKPEEQERRELFASRFLHSPVFELDSRRLQHLERRHEEPETLNQQTGQQGNVEGELDSEPVVLFHSRFLELTRLQQQKTKTPPFQASKLDTVLDIKEETEPAQELASQPPEVAETVKVSELKSISPVEEPQPVPSPVLQSVVKKEEVEDDKDTSPVPYIPRAPAETTCDSEASPVIPPEPTYSVDQGPLKERPTVETEDTKALSLGKTCSHDSHESLSTSKAEQISETREEVPKVFSPAPTRLLEDMDKVIDVPSTAKVIADEEENDNHRHEISSEEIAIVDEKSNEPMSPQKEPKGKEMKNKKNKQSPVQVPTPTVVTASSEKLATRKSERIDKEKLKRGSSPRAELRSAGKSPIHGSDPDVSEQQSIPLGRARRRNVKSVYATQVEDDPSVRSAKDIPESPRSARKRGTDKETTTHSAEQDPPAPTKRGRPPKNRKQTDESASARVEKSKMDNKDTDSNESESGDRLSRVSKGKSYPHSTKTTSSTSVQCPGPRKDTAEDFDNEAELADEHSMASHDLSSSYREQRSKVDQKKEEKDKQGKERGKDAETLQEHNADRKSNGKESESLVMEEKPVLEKDRSARGKTKLTRTPKSPVLKNLKIRLNVTEVKDLLQLGDDDLGNQDDATKKPASESSDCLRKYTAISQEGCNTEKDGEIMTKDPQESSKPSISQELELEQAVENIAKFTEPAFPTQPPTPPVTLQEIKPETEEEKPSNPASETELMAAIDSITAEETPVPLNQAPSQNSDVNSEPELQDCIQPIKDEEQPTTNMPAVEGESAFSTTPRKGPKGKAKTQKRLKNQKQARKDSKEGEELPNSLTESVTPSGASGSEATPTAAVAAVITPTAWIPEPEPSAVKAPTVKTEKEPSSEEHSQSMKSASPQSMSLLCPKPHVAQLQPIPSSSSVPSRQNIRPIQSTLQAIRNPVSPQDLHNPAKDLVVSSSPVMTVTSKDSLPLSVEPENQDSDHSTSDLRQILMKHKNMSLQASNLTNVRDLNPSESGIPSAVPSKSPLLDGRLVPHPAPSIVRSPVSLPSPETKPVISVIASTPTSVISRVCNPPEHEDKVTVNIANAGLDMTISKPSYRPSKDDNVTYHGPPVGDDVGSAARFIVDSSSLGTGSCPGLRVNTSEGVVVLSHSGQKTEGPQRISAKISQIPQATAGDMESQQLVSIPQMKQEMYGHTLSGLQKGPSQTDHVHLSKMQQSLSSVKQEAPSLEKVESAYQPGPQGVVKRLPPANQQLMSYHQDYMSIKHQKKIDSAEAHSADGAKLPWTSAISPHLPSPPGNHVGFVTGAGDRAPSHLSSVKQEPQSPRKSSHPHSPFAKVSSPIGSSSPKGITVMLNSGLPAMQSFIPGVHHTEQSVIMPPSLGRMSPHRVNPSIPVGHLVQGDVRVNTPPLSVMGYGMHSESLGSPWSGSLQPRPSSPQAVGREKVLKVNPGSLRSHEGEQDESRRFHQAPGRQSSTQLKPDVMQPDSRGPLRSSVPLEGYMSQRDMRVLMHQQGERLGSDPHGHIQETHPPSSAQSNLPLTLSPRTHVLPKGVSEKDVAKPLESKRAHSPLSKDAMMGIRQSGQAMASPQRVQLITGPSGSFPEYSAIYSNTRSIHPQMPETSSVGLNQPQSSIAPTVVSSCPFGIISCNQSNTKPHRIIDQQCLQTFNRCLSCILEPLGCSTPVQARKAPYSKICL